MMEQDIRKYAKSVSGKPRYTSSISDRQQKKFNQEYLQDIGSLRELQWFINEHNGDYKFRKLTDNTAYGWFKLDGKHFEIAAVPDPDGIQVTLKVYETATFEYIISEIFPEELTLSEIKKAISEYLAKPAQGRKSSSHVIGKARSTFPFVGETDIIWIGKLDKTKPVGCLKLWTGSGYLTTPFACNLSSDAREDSYRYELMEIIAEDFIKHMNNDYGVTYRQYDKERRNLIKDYIADGMSRDEATEQAETDMDCSYTSADCGYYFISENMDMKYYPTFADFVREWGI